MVIPTCVSISAQLFTSKSTSQGHSPRCTRDQLFLKCPPPVLGAAAGLSYPQLTSCIFTPTGPGSLCFPLDAVSHSSVWGWTEERVTLSPALCLCVSLAPEVLGNATSLQVQEGQSLRLVCETDGNPPGRLSWWRGSLTVSPSEPLDPGVLELPQVVVADAGEFTCRAQHPCISYHFSLNLVVQGEYWQDTCTVRWSHEED